MSQSPAQRQAARRQRLKDEGLEEVRGIFLPPAQHARLKAAARRLIPAKPPAR